MAFSAFLVASEKPASQRLRPRRWVGLLALIVASLGTMSLVGADSAQATGSFVSLANSARSAHGVKSLSTSSDLASVAQHQAARMAKQGVLAHNPNLASDVHHWEKLGENVGYGPDIQSIHDAFMHSAGHRANILDSDFTQVGVGVVVKDGVVWVAEVFRQTDGTATTAAKPKVHHSKPKPPVKQHAASPSAPANKVTTTPVVKHSTASTSSASPTTSPSSHTVKSSATPTPTPSVSQTATPDTSEPAAAPSTSSPVGNTQAAGPTNLGPTNLGPTKSADSHSGGTSLPAAGTLGLIAVLGLALSLRVRPTT